MQAANGSTSVPCCITLPTFLARQASSRPTRSFETSSTTSASPSTSKTCRPLQLIARTRDPCCSFNTSVSFSRALKPADAKIDSNLSYFLCLFSSVSKSCVEVFIPVFIGRMEVKSVVRGNYEEK